MKLLALPIIFTLLTFPVFAKEDSPRRVVSQEKREEVRLNSCEARENSITKRSESLGKMVSNMIAKFEAITERVTTFYETKVLPDTTVENYDGLINDINAKKEAVQTALDGAQGIMEDFTCDSDDPKSLLTQYREAMQSTKEALKEYRTAIRNLIVAVHTAAEGTSDEESEKE